MSSYNTDLDKNAANYVPLTPLTFIKRAKEIYPDYEALCTPLDVYVAH